MKTHNYFWLFIFFALGANAQAPQAINYQAVARDNLGNPLIGQAISLRFSIHDATSGGVVVYSESHSTLTNSEGLFSVNVGMGSVLSGTFSAINWGVNSKFLQVEMDPAGGTSYVNMGTQQMLSVPYALYAGSSNGWGLSGNSVAAGNFIGTTNGFPLIFKAANQPVGKLDYAFPNNTFLGYLAGNSLTTGRDNVAVGHDAFSLNTTGNENTVVGRLAMNTSVAAWGNTAIGFQSQYFSNSSGTSTFPYNTSIGHNSLRGSDTPANNTGNINTAIGGYTLYFNSTGTSNTALGFQSITFNTTGNENTAAGVSSLEQNTAGGRNVVIGFQAMKNNKIGNDNTAIGYRALYSNVGGNLAVAIGENSQYYVSDAPNFNNWNTSVGYSSLRGSFTASANTGLFNTAIGANAMLSNSSGGYNTASGHEAMLVNDIGNFNCAYGYQSLYANTTGLNNSAFGYQSLLGNTLGIRNTAFGDRSLRSNTTGLDNVACGANTLPLTTTSNYNTAIGPSAGALFIHGSFNTFLGHATSSNAGGYNNSTCIGSNTTVTASNQVRIGNGVTSIGGPQDWSNTSDGRIKQDVREDIPGIAFIRLLRPVSYTKSQAKEEEITGRTPEVKSLEETDYETMRHSGFIAQEVATAAEQSGYDFSGIDFPKNDKDLYSLRYAVFVVPLVKAVQEQQLLLEEKDREIADLTSQFEKLTAELASFRQELQAMRQQVTQGTLPTVSSRTK